MTSLLWSKSWKTVKEIGNLNAVKEIGNLNAVKVQFIGNNPRTEQIQQQARISLLNNKFTENHK